MAVRCQIVDDNEHFARTARKLLEGEGLAVVAVASTSEEALRQARDVRPDVSLVDIDLGGESGFVLAQQLADPGDAGRSCVILISGYAESEFAEMIEDSPAVAFLAKSSLSGAAIRDILGRCTEGQRAC